MSLRSRAEPHRVDRSPKYLPYLTWTLLLLLFAYLVVWYLYYRPTTETQLQMASLQSAMRYIRENYVYQVDQGRLYRGAMRGMVQALDDKYSYYLDAVEWRRVNEETEGEYVGIGVRITRRNNWSVLAEVFKGGPAAQAGLKAGDIISAVDGQDAQQMSMEKLVFKIRGKPGTAVRLDIRRPPDGETMAVVLTRASIEVPNVRDRFIEDGIGLLRIAGFDKNVSQEVEEALTRLAEGGLRALVLDLRGNSGGLMEQAVEVCDQFLADGEILRLQGRAISHAAPFYATARVTIDPSVPVVVLVDQGTASAAEIVAGTLQATGRAVVIGTRTFGKGSVTNLVPLPDGSGVLLTVAHYVLAGAVTVEGHGVMPDIVVGQVPAYPLHELDKVPAWREAIRQAAQEQERQAVRYLKEKLGRTEPAP